MVRKAQRILGPRLIRVYRVLTIFNEDVIVENFLHIENAFPLTTMTASPKPFRFEYDDPISLPNEFAYQREVINTQAHFAETSTTGLLVFHYGKITLENY